MKVILLLALAVASVVALPPTAKQNKVEKFDAVALQVNWISKDLKREKLKLKKFIFLQQLLNGLVSGQVQLPANIVVSSRLHFYLVIIFT